MTKRQAEIFRLAIVEGLTNVEIGERLFIAPSTVKTAMRNFMYSHATHTDKVGFRGLLAELCGQGFLAWTLDKQDETE